VWYNNSI